MGRLLVLGIGLLFSSVSAAQDNTSSAPPRNNSVKTDTAKPDSAEEPYVIELLQNKVSFEADGTGSRGDLRDLQVPFHAKLSSEFVNATFVVSITNTPKGNEAFFLSGSKELRGATTALAANDGHFHADELSEKAMVVSSVKELGRQLVGKEYNGRMGNRSGENLKVTCPCCQAKLTVDPIFGAVLSHEAPPKAGPNIDLDKAHDILAEQKRQREDKFADSFFQETHKEDILAKKFEEAMKKAKDAPAGKPIRDFDLD